MNKNCDNPDSEVVLSQKFIHGIDSKRYFNLNVHS